ncbi:autophagy-related protein 11-domain-containing protein [Microdochium trichocladiopsis]|uniref:Autophagy-related protein 11 n=1 Tax=Microdochium trichocladiopsis TaxID=1682393 RepID=A0A9P9BR96_9PEZI|nr:autophagy-related protein 11-domain-containing protein [Microdochium trichocladiopsis]KAH7026667.1 autophagy-related protein 11-domain-containing protein [Microdochium trichocladiopsis]
MASQTQVLIAPTGQRLQTDLSEVTSLDDFKAWVSSQSGIPVHNIVALNTQGKTIKLQTIKSETEVFIYDIRATQVTSPGASTALTSEFPLPKKYVPTAPPNAINDTHSLSSWQALFKSRRDWALVVVGDCTAMLSAINDRHSEMDVMLRCLDAAVANLDTALKPIEPKFVELKKWATPTQQDYEMLTNNWESYLELARSIDISPAMMRYMTGRDLRKARQATLEDLVDPETSRKAGKLAATSLRKFNSKIADLEKNADKMFKSCDELFQSFDKLLNRSVMKQAGNCKELLSDIEAVANKVDTDYQATLQYSSQSRDLSQASKTAQNHTRQLLPSLQKRATEMDDLLQYITESRNSIAAESLMFMRTISEITSLHSTVKNQMNVLNQGEEEMTTFDYLRLIQQLPFMYASFVAEAVRRREWGDKVKTDSSTLVNEMALFQDEELKRRRKWQKMVGSTYGPDKAENNVLGLEVNLLGEEDVWPSMSRQDLEDFLSTIQRHKADPSVIEDVTKLIEELRTPTKQQSKRLKAFKNGSMHEAALGRSGLLIRGDDELLRSLQDDKTKLEGKLKTAESRVRRLEDLLHRQSQASRPSIGNLFQSHDRDSSSSIKSPRPQEDRRRSSIDGAEALFQRIAKLEADLNAERERAANLEKDANERAEILQRDMDHANLMKVDLLGNMEAQKKEFVEERKSLEDEIKQLKARIEETEDEIEHYGESRENEKLTFNERFHALTLDVERLNREKRDEALKTQGQVDFLRNEARVERERNVSLERQLQEARDAIRALTKRCQTADESTEAHTQSLRDLHSQLAPRTPAPADIADLIESVVSKSNDVLVKVQALEQDLSLMKADLDMAQGQVKDTKSELSTTREKLTQTELDFVHLRESMDEEKARCVTLEAEVKETRDQLNSLRTRMTEGETGSETLRKQLSDEEQKVADLNEQLASRQSQLGSLDEEVRMYQERLQSSESRLSALGTRHDERSLRSKELTQRLYTQNERLTRLLERLSFSVSRKDGTMVIQKIPRAERTPQNPNDSSDPNSSTIRQSMSLANNPMADSADLKLLYWMNAENAQIESDQYQAYMSGPGSFDIDAFSDAVYRRIKEVEHTARKMTREARAYRERAHNLAKDAHDKIAFRHFKEGDLALFLPTRNQTTGAWAAFNVGCPHFFLREQESHRLRSREWLVARITRVQERVVDLSKSLQSTGANASEAETDSLNTTDDFDNPFDLSDGLRWWLIDAQEDKPGAPSTPGLGKSTVAANTVAAVADMQGSRGAKSKSKLGRPSGIEDLSKTLSKSLDSRRSSTGSKKAIPFAVGANAATKGSALASETNSLRAAPAESPLSGTSPGAASRHRDEADATGTGAGRELASAVEENRGSGKMTAGAAATEAVAGSRGNDNEVRQSHEEIDTLLGP